ncbi:MAG: WG repeat-containing protein [Sedimentisphaerales bacterium]|nr:WG repeat-containing protein [Sedimentisphaerales bacterium]
MLRHITKVLEAASVCFIALPLTLSCEVKGHSPNTYERDYLVDWKHGFQEDLGEVEVNGRWGFINSTGELVIKPKFNEVVYITLPKNWAHN